MTAIPELLLDMALQTVPRPCIHGPSAYTCDRSRGVQMMQRCRLNAGAASDFLTVTPSPPIAILGRPITPTDEVP